MSGDWFVGLTDVVGSTDAIKNGKYKSVNMAGTAAISAVINMLSHQNYPFVFGGDGVNFAVPEILGESGRRPCKHCTQGRRRT